MNQIKIVPKISFLLCLLCLPLCLAAQIKQNSILRQSRLDALQQETRGAFLQEKSRRDSSSYVLERAAAIQFANQFGYPVAGNFKGREYSLQGFDDFGQLRYYQTKNAISAEVIGTDQLYPGGGLRTMS